MKLQLLVLLGNPKVKVMTMIRIRNRRLVTDLMPKLFQIVCILQRTLCKSVRICSAPGPYFPEYGVSLRIQC